LFSLRIGVAGEYCQVLGGLLTGTAKLSEEI